jgi:predicted TIM-barrel fold metal-dependent hydrolase
MIPYFPAKIKLGFRQIFHGTAERNPAAEVRGLKKPPLDYFKILYADTALGGEPAPTRCGHAFFGTRHCLFATDAPFDPERGRALIADTLAGVTALGLAEADMTLIFAGNAQRLLKL